MATNRLLAVAFAAVAAIAAAAIGYIAGGRFAGAPAPSAISAVEVDALVKQAIAAQLKATPLQSNGTSSLAAELSNDQRLEVQGIIKNYLLANPEIIRDAINELQIREDAAARAAQVAAISDNASLLFNSNRHAVFGNPTGDVTLVEFFDYNCTYCRASHQDMLDLIAKDPQLRVVMKEFPVLGDGSVQAAQVAVAVNLIAPEKYFAFHDALLREKGQIGGERALAIAGEIGLDPEVVRAKLSDQEIQNTINESYDLAGKLGLTGTPSYVTQKEVIVGAVGYTTLRARLDDARNCLKTATC
jgi:protein-disulfide isomerase